MSAKTKSKKSGGALEDCKILHAATEEFVRANNHFESSFPVNAALEEMAKCRTFGEVFALPLQHKLFSMDEALHWVLFLKLAPERAVKEGDTTTLIDDFSANEALEKIRDIYDIGVQSVVWEHFEQDDEDDEEDDDEDEEDEDTNGSKKKATSKHK